MAGRFTAEDTDSSTAGIVQALQRRSKYLLQQTAANNL